MDIKQVRDELDKGMRQFLYLEEGPDGAGWSLRYAVGTRNHTLVEQGMRSVGAHFHGGKGPEQYKPNEITNYWDDTQAAFRCFYIDRFLGFVDDLDMNELAKKLKEFGIK